MDKTVILKETKYNTNIDIYYINEDYNELSNLLDFKFFKQLLFLPYDKFYRTARALNIQSSTFNKKLKNPFFKPQINKYQQTKQKIITYIKNFSDHIIKQHLNSNPTEFTNNTQFTKYKQSIQNLINYLTDQTLKNKPNLNYNFTTLMTPQHTSEKKKRKTLGCFFLQQVILYSGGNWKVFHLYLCSLF